MKFPLRISSANVTKSTFLEEILNGKLHFLCNELPVTEPLRLPCTQNLLHASQSCSVNGFIYSQRFVCMKQIENGNLTLF